ncbi:MAG TPA: CBS domain-containing protein [Sphingomicrobium sp.]
MQVSEVMTREVELVVPQTSIVEAARRMRDADVGALPVGEDGRLSGMVTDRDIVVRAVAEGRAVGEATVSDVLSSDIVSCREDDSVEDAANLMAQHQIRRLPVLGDNQQLLGILSLADVARTDQDSGGAALDDISEPTS